MNKSRVRKVTKLSVSPTKVYDIEVPKYSNFMLANGIIVHNSKDMSDSLCGALWSAVNSKYVVDKAVQVANYQYDMMKEEYEDFTRVPDNVRNDHEIFSKLDEAFGEFDDDYESADISLFGLDR